jgi:osmoprotectant transport system ATP-binding protein
MITVEDVSKAYGGQTALAPTTLEFAEGKTTVLIGPSGCGKSTLLRILVGLIAPDDGTVHLDGQPMTPSNVETLRHGIGYVIQDGGLFPHLTAERNVTLLARYLKRPSDEIESRVGELADLVQLPREALTRFPSNLSGGQRQRVGLMRALMLDPKLLLLDEPLGALDPITRYELQTQLKEIFERLGKTVILVTHDMGEAAYFATGQIVLMQTGKIVQRGSLDDLLKRPAQPYVSQVSVLWPLLV